MTYNEKKREYNTKYTQEHYKQIGLRLSNDMHKRVQDAAATTGESVNGYIKTAIERRLESGE